MRTPDVPRLLAVSLALLALGAASPRASRAAISLTHSGDLDVEAIPYSIATADLNHDGNLDLAVASASPDGLVGIVSVLLGNGDGTFGPRTNYPYGDGSTAIAAGDVNRDGNPDLVVATFSSIGVLLGAGDGSFAPAVTFEPQGARSVEIADLNADGQPDVVAATDPAVIVRLGNGDGTFGPGVDVPIGSCAGGDVLVADVNGDGRPDVTTVTCTGFVSILLGNGNGTLQPPVEYFVSDNLAYGDVGDLNSDGFQDLVVSNPGSSAVSILIGNGDGTFRPSMDFETGVFPVDAKIADFNSDNIPDLAVAVQDGNALEMLVGRGDGTFEPKCGFPTGFSARLATGDWNRDGLLDVAVSDIGAGGSYGFGDPGHRLLIFRNTPGVPVGNSPAVTAPATVRGDPNSLMTFTVSAVDPDGDPIINLKANGLLSGMSFTTNPSNTSGTFSWTPDATREMNVWQVTFVASNNLTVSAMTEVRVNTPPVLEAIADMTVTAGSTADQGVTATHFDGDAITFTASLPGFATLTVNPPVEWTRTGNIHVAPPPGTSGTFNASVTATSGGQSDTKNFLIVVVDATDRAPVVTAPAAVSGSVNTLITFTVSASDPDGDAIASLTAAPLPPGAAFTSNAAHTSGTFAWTPALAQAGTYAVTSTALNALSGSATTAVTVGGPQVIFDDFNDNTLDPTRWRTIQTGSGTTVIETNQQLEIAHSANSAGDGTGSFGISYLSHRRLTGDYDIQVDFHLLDWPYANGVRTALVTNRGTTEGATQRVSFGTPADFPGAPREVYAKDFGDGVYGLVSTTDLSGTLRQVRSGNTLTGYYWSDGGWVPLGSASVAATDVSFGVASWSHDYAFTDQFVRVAFDNFIINQGQFATGAPVVTAPAEVFGVPDVLLTFTVTASDPDGEAISSLTAAPLPAGAAFTPNATSTSGTFSWTPTSAQTGTFAVTFTAANALAGSATTDITIGDRPPVVTAPATVSGIENTLITFTVSATDPDGDAVTSLTAAALPPGATFISNAAHTSGTFSWTPSTSQLGTYAVTFTASNSLSGSATTSITVSSGPDRAPVVTAPATVVGAENTLITFTVSATDPDGQAIASLTAASSPATTGSTFTVGPGNTSGTFAWTPSFVQAGTYAVTFTATNSLSGSATTAITVSSGPGRPPVVTAPATASGNENTLITLTVTAADPDGDAITSLTAAGLPAGATFVANASNTSGTFSWTPSFAQSGTYSVTFRASSNSLTGTATTSITVNNLDRTPVVTAPTAASGQEGALITFTVSAVDPDGDAITSLAGAPLPPGATFTVNAAYTSGTFAWIPSFMQSGTYGVTFTATNALSGSATTTITVDSVNRAPMADAGGPYSGVTGFAILFDGSGSADPDGDPLTYSWDFGDGSGSASGVTATHTYVAAGSYTAALTVTDSPGMLSDTHTALVEVGTALAATAFTTGGNRTTSLATGKPYTCIQLEAVEGSFVNSDVDLPSVRMISVGTGSVTEIFADASKATVEGDRDGDGIAEIAACFRKPDLRLLFGDLPAGMNSVTVEIRGELTSGLPFSAALTLTVKSTGGALAASISPNPLNPKATLSFATSKPGAIRVQMFDPRGRLVKTVADETSVGAGYHDLSIDGTNADGTRLASGVYFVKIWSRYDGQQVKSITILK